MDCGGLTPLCGMAARHRFNGAKASSVFLHEIAGVTESGVKPPQSE